MLRNRAGGLYCSCKGFETKLKKEVLIEADSPPLKPLKIRNGLLKPLTVSTGTVDGTVNGYR